MDAKDEQVNPNDANPNEQITPDDDASQDQLIEIYKVQSQLTNSISTRRTITNRYYLLVMSGLTFVFSTLLQNIDKIPSQFLKVVSAEWLIVVLGAVGIALSWSWCVSINSYLRLNSRKYEVLKILETKLEYQFFQKEWEFLGKDRSYLTYWQLSANQLSVPAVFFIIFTVLLGMGVYSLENNLYRLFLLGPASLIVTFCIVLFNQLATEKSNRKELTNDKVA